MTDNEDFTIKLEIGVGPKILCDNKIVGQTIKIILNIIY